VSPPSGGLLIVVEAALAGLVVALAALRAAVAPPLRPTGVCRRLEATAACATAAWATTAWATTARATGEIGTPIAHRAAVAGTAVSTAATATAAVATTATATAIAAATTAAVAATTPAAVGRTRAARTEAAATTAAAAKSATATTTGLAFDGFADGNRSAVEQGSVHGLHRGSTLIICFHLEEREAAAAAGLAIHDHFRRGDGAELGEGFLQTLGRDRIGQIAHKQFTTHSWLGAGEEGRSGVRRALAGRMGSKRFVDL
jgi:hypothetical protein